MVIGQDYGPLNIWCEFETDPLKTQGRKAHTRKMKLAHVWPKMEPQSAIN